MLLKANSPFYGPFFTKTEGQGKGCGISNYEQEGQGPFLTHCHCNAQKVSSCECLNINSELYVGGVHGCCLEDKLQELTFSFLLESQA